MSISKTEKKVHKIKPMHMCGICQKPYKDHLEVNLGHNFSLKFVAGVVNIDPKVGVNHPYTFFELDTIDDKIREHVLRIYKKYNLDLVEQKLGKGYHFFGSKVDRQIWMEWYSELKHLNPDYPPLTLRISPKYDNEIFERPTYYESQEVVPNWSKSLMAFINKVIKGKSNDNLWMALNQSGCQKYFKCTVYPIELKI